MSGSSGLIRSLWAPVHLSGLIVRLWSPFTTLSAPVVGGGADVDVDVVGAEAVGGSSPAALSSPEPLVMATTMAMTPATAATATVVPRISGPLDLPRPPDPPDPPG